MKIVNRKFGREFEKLESFEAGIILTGPEVKSVREGNIKLEDSFIKIIQNEPYLVNAEIYPYKFAPADAQEAKRSRKLLLHGKELLKLKTKLHGASGLTIAPVSCYNKGDLIKLEIALARGRKDVEKRKVDKQKKVERREKREVKEFMKN